MRSRIHWSRFWKSLLGLCGVLVACSSIAARRTLCPRRFPQHRHQRRRRRAAAPVTVEQLAERLRAMEEMNTKARRATREDQHGHDEQMKQLLERFGELSSRLNDGENERGDDQPATPAGTAPPSGRRSGGISATLPCRTTPRGSSSPTRPHRDTRSRTSPAPRGCRCMGTFGPGFQFETEDEEFRLQVPPRVADRGTDLGSARPGPGQ